MTIHAFSSFSHSYLNRARVLARPLRAQHPDWVIWAVLTDKEPEGFVFDLENEDFDRVLRVNLRGVFLTGQAAARQMAKQEADTDGHRGTIINMSSVNAVMAIPQITPYVVAKGGVNQLTKVMALNLVTHGIRVTGIGPGSINTEVFAAVNNDPEKRKGVLMRTPMGRAGEPGEVASIALFLATEDSSYITGQTIYPDGGRLSLNYVVPVPD